jgi:ribonuclease J
MTDQPSAARRSRRRRRTGTPSAGVAAKGRLRILPLGGLGEIGKNMTLIEFDGRILVVDAGVRFPTAEMHGIDLVLPDFAYLTERAEQVEGIVLTHGHEDHVGALPWVLRELGEANVPGIYGRRLTAAMARSKLDEHKLRATPINPLDPGERVKLGPFEIELIHVTHSIPDTAAVAIRTPLGTVLMTADYRFDQSPVDGIPPDISRLAALGDEGVLVLCGDSTNADRLGVAPSESDIGPELERVFARCRGRIVVTSFASNIHRVQQVVDAAIALNRRVALVGRSMIKNVNIGRNLGHISAPEDVWVDARDIDSVDGDRLVIVSTGSQGEPLSALRRMAYSQHRDVELRPGDTIVFSATPIPGNERAVNDTIDHLYRTGCDVVTARDAAVHTSGHGHREELKMMLNLIRPQYLVPVHGDHKRIHLHGLLGEATGIPPARIFKLENGLPLDIDERAARVGEPEQAGMVFVDGLEIGEPADAALRDRRALAAEGVLFVVATVSEQDGETVAPPEVVIRGVPALTDAEGFVEEIRDAIENSLDRAADEGVHEVELLEKMLHDDLADFINRRVRRRPMILPVVVEV